MRKLVVLWDPENPIVPAASVVHALQGGTRAAVKAVTFDELGHRTLPNRTFDLRPLLGGEEPEGILWVEGGPLPADLPEFSCPKVCWLLNTHLEPTLLDDLGPLFDRVFSASLPDSAEERATWLPPPSENGRPVSLPPGVSLLVNDSKPPSHIETEHLLTESASELGSASGSVVVCSGNAGQPHPMLMEALRSGAAVVADPETELRGLAQPGEHIEVYPSKEELVPFVRELLRDDKRLKTLSERGPAIVRHLHTPELRATLICEGLWPTHRVLSGREHRSRISILVTCYRYLRRFRVCLESLVRQELSSGSLEIVVADPGSPDGLVGYLEEFAGRHPDVRIIHLPIDPRYHRNRGVGINRAFDVSRGEVVIGIDGDIIFPSHLIGVLEERVRSTPDRACGVRRAFVNRETTEKILDGKTDPFDEFNKLSASDGDGEEKSFVGVLGYCQAVHRKAFAKARYPEEFDTVNQSDIVFVERLGKEVKVLPQYLEDEVVLHLWHPRNWMGTSELL